MAISKTLRYQILRRDNNTCRTCGRSAPEVKLHVDHVIPEALGGRTEASNLQTLCSDCNGGKSATPPDAAQVEQVSADALRWAEAQQIVVAQMLTRHRAKESLYDTVDAAWDRWCDGKLERPSDWRQSVDQLLGAGLPLEMFTDAIDVAMANSKVRSQNLWRYACGIGWNRVAEIREATASALGGVPASTDMPTSGGGRDSREMTGWNQARTELASEILDYFTDDQRQELLIEVHQAAMEEGDELSEAEGEESPYLVGRAAVRAFEHLRVRAIRMERLAAILLEQVDPHLRADIVAEATGDLQGAHPEGFSKLDLAWWSFYCLVDRVKNGAVRLSPWESLVGA